MEFLDKEINKISEFDNCQETKLDRIQDRE